jgi:hypothetical protein
VHSHAERGNEGSGLDLDVGDATYFVEVADFRTTPIEPGNFGDEGSVASDDR